MTLNEVLDKFRSFSFPLREIELTFHTALAAAYLIGYSLLMITYMKHIYSKLMIPNLTSAMQPLHSHRRRENLYFFLIFGAPLVMNLSSRGDLGLKDIFILKLLRPDQSFFKLEVLMSFLYKKYQIRCELSLKYGYFSRPGACFIKISRFLILIDTHRYYVF